MYVPVFSFISAADDSVRRHVVSKSRAGKDKEISARRVRRRAVSVRRIDHKGVEKGRTGLYIYHSHEVMTAAASLLPSNESLCETILLSVTVFAPVIAGH